MQTAATLIGAAVMIGAPALAGLLTHNGWVTFGVCVVALGWFCALSSAIRPLSR